MDYSKIVAVTGLPGLYELLSSKTDGALVRSLDDNSTKFASSRIHNFSHLESIEVYTVADNVNLVDVFSAMDKSGGFFSSSKKKKKPQKKILKNFTFFEFFSVVDNDFEKKEKMDREPEKKKVENQTFLTRTER